jgi:hypothetical protein
MKRAYAIAMVAGVCAFGAAAQEGVFQVRTGPEQMKVEMERLVANAKVLSVEGGVMGSVVKDAPYSADETRESTQMLADGTRIHNENKVTVYRDSVGRMRRESGNEITIWDPANGTSYVLNPKTMTARKMSLNFTYVRTATGGGAAAGAMAGEKPGGTVTFRATNITTVDAPQVLVTSDAKGLAEGKMVMARAQAGKKESLGAQTMEGVLVQGERVTFTMEAGAIGNDRPIQTMTEHWYSPDLQVNVLTKRTDPRNGDETTKLTNIHRGEPSPVLFELPPGYTVTGAK